MVFDKFWKPKRHHVHDWRMRETVFDGKHIEFFRCTSCSETLLSPQTQRCAS